MLLVMRIHSAPLSHHPKALTKATAVVCFTRRCLCKYSNPRGVCQFGITIISITHHYSSHLPHYPFDYALYLSIRRAAPVKRGQEA